LSIERLETDIFSHSSNIQELQSWANSESKDIDKLFRRVTECEDTAIDLQADKGATNVGSTPDVEAYNPENPLLPTSALEPEGFSAPLSTPEVSTRQIE
jgi:hypothetical protein